MDVNLEELMKTINLSKDIDASDIPNIDLYMEQLTNFFDESLGELKRNKDDKLLTKTMINSYTKDGILIPPKNKKKYTKYHIITLILIYHLKQILTINDIHALFKPILKDVNTENDDVIPLEDIYSIFLEMKNTGVDNFHDICSDKLELIKEKISKINVPEDEKDTAEIFLTIITLVAEAEANKRLAEKLIDTYFNK